MRRHSSPLTDATQLWLCENPGASVLRAQTGGTGTQQETAGPRLESVHLYAHGRNLLETSKNISQGEVLMEWVG